MRRAALLVFCLLAAPLLAQEISNGEAGRPITLEDAFPVAVGSYSGSFDYAFAWRRDSVEYSGPALAILYGAYRGLEAGAETRVLTSPRRNASRGIGSGDLDVHLLGSIVSESPRFPAIALRFDMFLPTGFASHGLNISPRLLMTKSFETIRVHANVGTTYITSLRIGERRSQLFAAVGFDVLPGSPWDTDTLLMADVIVRQSVTSRGDPSAGVELGLKQRIGMQTVLYAGAASEIAGEPDRVRFRGILGVTHAF
jgi:hypothetical protein